MKYPQESYAAVVRAIQSKWIFLKCITNNTGYKFTVVDKILQETFMQQLFFRGSKYLTPIIGALSTISDKKASLGLQNPMSSLDKKYLSLWCTRTEMIQVGMGEGEFSTAYHMLELR